MRFLYQAKSFKGEVKTGSMEARDKRELAQLLRDQGFVLISASSAGSTESKDDAGASRFDLGEIFGRFFGVKLVEKMMFARHLSVMIGAGLSLNRSLVALAGQASSKKFNRTLTLVEEDVRKGESFADALAKHPREFNELFVSMIRVGEESGTLEDVLKVLARQMKKDHDLISRVRGAMVYPVIIITVMVGIGILMMILVIPRLAEVFSDLDVELPVTTRAVIFIGTFLSENVLLVLLAIPILIFLGKIIISSSAGKNFFDWLFLRFPLISGITEKVNSARFARTLSSLTRSGVPIVRSLEILSGTLTNHYYKESIIASIEKVKKGEELNKSIAGYPKLYPPIVVQMVAVGEETGALAEVMQRLASFYETEVSNITRNLSSVIEPILMVVIGIMVGFFAVSMIQPMYSMLGSI